MDDCIYIVCKGEFRILYDIQTEEFKDVFPREVNQKYNCIVLGNLKKGEIFGEHSAVNGAKNPYTVVVRSQSAVVFKINRMELSWVVKKTQSNTISELRA